jgi:hypothetical protein
MADNYDVIVVGAGPAEEHSVGRCREAGFAPWWWSTDWWAVPTDPGEIWSSSDLGKEGTFVLCTFWLDQALALADRPHRARAVFERAVAYVLV